MKLLGKYLRSRLLIIIMLGVFAAVCAAVFLLYRVKLEALVYCLVLCATVAMIFGICDFYFFAVKHKTLSGLLGNILTVSDGLPENVHNEVEADYIGIIRGLCAENSRISEKYFLRSRERDEYYTLWMHQIKTPISALRLIIGDGDTKKSEELESQLFMIERYVTMALAFLRTESESTDFLFREYDLDSIVRASIRKYAPLFIHKKLNVDKKSIDAKVITDEKWLSFVVEQILSNAIKYTKNGSVTIYTENNDTLIIKDTGIGIAPEDLPRICENGFTGYNGRIDKRASGIGLYLSNKIIKKLGHSLKIESELNVGTKVSLILHTDKTVFD